MTLKHGDKVLYYPQYSFEGDAFCSDGYCVGRAAEIKGNTFEVLWETECKRHKGQVPRSLFYFDAPKLGGLATDKDLFNLSDHGCV